jgi:hypothetical protein
MQILNKKNMLNYLRCILIGLCLLKPLFSNAQLKVYIISDSKEYDRNKLNEQIKNIYFKKKLSVSEFKIFHFTPTIGASEKWQEGKKNVYYTPQAIKCDYKKCDKLNELITLIQTEKTKLYNYGEFESCVSKIPNLEISILPNFDVDKIYEIIKEEGKRNKKAKTELSLIFYISGKLGFEKKKLIFPIDSASIESGKSYELVNNNKEFESFNWLPNTGVNCAGCEKIIINPIKSTSYTITAIDKNGCQSEPFIFEAKVKNRCNEFREPVLMFEENGKLTSSKYHKVKKEKEKYVPYKWTLSPNQNGAYYYDIITKSNCCENFKVVVYNKKNINIWEGTFLREDIDHGFDIHKTDKGKFVFRLDLSPISKEIEDSESDDYWYIEIECIDNENSNYKTHRSFYISLQKC